MNATGLQPPRAECRHETRRGSQRRFRARLTAFVIAALALPWSGCSVFLIDSSCRRFTVEDPLLDAHFFVMTEPLRAGVVTPQPANSLHLLVGHGGEAMMVHQPTRRDRLRGRCRPLAADDLAEVTRAVERLERSVVVERKINRPGCLEMTAIVLRDDRLLEGFSYCGTTPPEEIVRFVNEIAVPLGRRFGKELATGLAAAAPWASPVPLDPPEG